MTEIRFVTREIGSLAKPGWRVKALAGRPVEEKDVEEAREWGWRLGIDSGELAEILRKGGSFTNEEKVRYRLRGPHGIRILEHAGLDVVSTASRPQRDVRSRGQATKGFETRGTVRSSDNKYYTKLRRRELSWRGYDPKSSSSSGAHADRIVRPVHWRYTIMDWSYDALR